MLSKLLAYNKISTVYVHLTVNWQGDLPRVHGQSSDVHLGRDGAPLQTNAGRDAMELSSFWKPLAVAGVRLLTWRYCRPP